jgi:hypothetical protein
LKDNQVESLKSDYKCLEKILISSVFTTKKELFDKLESGLFEPRTWNMLPENLKQIRSLEGFKRKIRKWKPTNCPCRICKHYIAGVGFI